MLLHSDSGGLRWEVLEIPASGFSTWVSRLESLHGSFLRGPPAILSYEADDGGASGNHKLILHLTYFDRGRLLLKAVPTVANNSGLGPHQGEVQQLYQTRKGVTVFFPTTESGVSRRVTDSNGASRALYGSRMYARTFDKVTESWGSSVYIGAASNSVLSPTAPANAHDQPSAVIDSKGRFHVLLGGHAGNLMYSKSLKLNTASGGFSPPKVVGNKSVPTQIGLYTYVSVVIDTQDTIHVVTRLSHGFRLVYLRKRSQESDFGWIGIPHRILIDPTTDGTTSWNVGYGNYNQKLFVDVWNRFHLFIHYIPQRLIINRPKNWDQPEQYRVVHGLPAMTAAQPCDMAAPTSICNYLETTNRNPELFMSKDFGVTWDLTKTPDF